MLKIFNVKMLLLIILAGVFLFIILIINRGSCLGNLFSLKSLDLSCNAYGSIYVNGYNFQYVENYRFYKNSNGNLAVSGKVFDRNGFLGIVGLKTSFSYSYSNGMVTMRTTDSITQVDNSLSKNILLNIMPSAFINKNEKQIMMLYKLGDGYRIDFNTHPTAYCY